MYEISQFEFLHARAMHTALLLAGNPIRLQKERFFFQKSPRSVTEVGAFIVVEK